MKQTRTIMAMPVVVEIDDREAAGELFDEVFAYLTYADETFSFFKPTSEVSAINRGELEPRQWSDDMKEIFACAEDTKRITGGYFDIVTPGGAIDPSGIVKGWAIEKVAQLLRACGVKNFYVEIAGDIAVGGMNAQGELWRIGIENPLKVPGQTEWEVVKVVRLSDKGIATSGTYRNGTHIYDPLSKRPPNDEVVSLTVIGPNVYEADRFATAAFAMGRPGIEFIERLEGFEGYQIDNKGTAIMTSGFEGFVQPCSPPLIRPSGTLPPPPPEGRRT